METHVKVLGTLQIVFGVMGLFGVLALVLVFGSAVGIVGTSGDPEARVAIPIIGITGLALVTFLAMLSLPGIIVGIGLLKHRPWARIAGIVLSILSLMMIPLGTIVGAYGLWVLFSPETERLFASSAVSG